MASEATCASVGQSDIDAALNIEFLADHVLDHLLLLLGLRLAERDAVERLQLADEVRHQYGHAIHQRGVFRRHAGGARSLRREQPEAGDQQPDDGAGRAQEQ